MHTCTWAPSTFSGTQVVKSKQRAKLMPKGRQLRELVRQYVQRLEQLDLSHLLIAQRWWGNASDIEGSTLDCLAMTDYIAAHSNSIRLVTAIHPGFFHPAVIAKWAATLDNLSDGRWSINVTSGWNLEEFSKYGIDPLDHGGRYARSSEFIEVLRGAWDNELFNYQGSYYQVQDLVLEPRPTSPLEVFQGGQSDAAITMAVQQSDWMFLNGGSLEKVQGLIDRVRARAGAQGAPPRFAVYGIPLCRATDAAAEQEISTMLNNIDPVVLAARRKRVIGAEGMWANADALSMLDTNEGYATGLIGSPETIIKRLAALESVGVDMIHLSLGDPLFENEVLPVIQGL